MFTPFTQIVYLATPLFRKLTLNSIDSERLNVERACLSSSQIDVPQESERTSANIINQFYGTLSSDPSSLGMPVLISSLWPVLAAKLHQAIDKEIAARIVHRDIMFATVSAWAWLEDHCVKVIADYLMGRPVPDTWVVQLTEYVLLLVQTRVVTRDIHPSKFSDQLPGEVFHYSLTGRKYLDSTQQILLVTRTTLEIVQTWLGFPTGKNSRSQGLFLILLVRSCGHDILFLDSIWSAYNNICRQVLMRSSPPSPSLLKISIFDPFMATLKSHPIQSRLSPHRLSIDLMTRHIYLYMHHRSSIAQHIDPLTKRITYTDPDDPTGTLAYVLLYLRELLPLLPGRPLLKESAMTPLQYVVHHNRDRLLPFRERAPTRVHFLEGNSPYSADVVRTRSGFFSALIMRGITFNTEFSRTKQTLFRDIDDWNDYISTFSNYPPTFLCDTRAYGTPIGKRSIGLADGYWDATLEGETWSEFVGSHTIPFDDCVQFILNSNPTKRFLEIGPFIAYLTAVDFAYAGVVEVPSTEEMGKIICNINRGAAAGLESLGLIPRRPITAAGSIGKSTIAACQSGFSHMQTFLGNHLTDKEKEDMVFDGFLGENTSCKLQRAINLQVFDVPTILL